MNPQDLPKGPSGEIASLDGKKPSNPAGVYRHEAAGKEIIVMPDPTSTAQQDALVRLGFVWVAEPPTRQQLAEMQAKQLASDLADEAAGKVPTPYLVPGEQETVFNGTVTDSGGQGDALAAKDEEIRLLNEKLSALEAGTSTEEVAKVDAATTETENEDGTAEDQSLAEEAVSDPAEDPENQTNKEGN